MTIEAERLAFAEAVTVLEDAFALTREDPDAVEEMLAPLPVALDDVIGTRQAGDAVTFPAEGVDGGSISMLSVQLGRT